MFKNPSPLYEICIEVAVDDCDTVCKFCHKEFRCLPNNVLFDFYHKMFTKKQFPFLGHEFERIDIIGRMLNVKHCRVNLLKIIQALYEQGIDVPKELVQRYINYHQDDNIDIMIDMGMKMGGFFLEGGWYDSSVKILNRVEKLCQKQSEDVDLLERLLECYHKRIYAEAFYCDFDSAKLTIEAAQMVIKKLEKFDKMPNLAGIYSNFSLLYFIRSEYNEAYNWSKKALECLRDDLPSKLIIDVLRQASNSCVVKCRIDQAGILIRQAMALATQIYQNDTHPHYSNTLLDYGFYLLNSDSVDASIAIYTQALDIRRNVFEKHNIQVAIAHEDFAYALYITEYRTGNFYTAREHIERAIKIMERILPVNHLRIATTMRVKALILEEMALDLRRRNDTKLCAEYLTEAESLHQTALKISYNVFGEMNVQTAKHYGNLGRLYQTMKQYAKAEQMHLHALEIKENLLGVDSFEVGLSVGHLASLYNYHMDRYKDAERLYGRSIKISMKMFGESYSNFEIDYRGLINVYAKLADQTNVAKYTSKMRDWRRLRDRLANEKIGNTLKDEILRKLNDVIDEFFRMCL